MSYLDTLDQGKVQASILLMRANPERFEHVTRYAGGDERFGLWLALVDQRLSRTFGIGLFDLADWPIRDAYDDGLSPKDAAQLALDSDDLYAGLAVDL